MDEMMFNQSPYKPEITYDMHTDPPSPIMDKNILTKGHEYVWGWIKKNWLNDKGYEYEKGQGMSRRPDVVIVKDPNLPPTQDNIKHVVEIKFGTDTFEKPQRDAYTEIAGDRTKVKVLDPDECGCNSDDDGKKSTVTEWATAAVATLVALAQLRKGKILKCQNSHPLHFNLEKEMHFKTEEDYKAWVATQEKGAIGGGLLTPQGGEDYVGAIPAIRAVLYF